MSRLQPLAAGLCLAAAFMPLRAGAQPPSTSVAARALLIEQAERARVAGDHREALNLAERAGRIEMTTSLRMFLAEEQIETRAFAAAMASALLCVREAQRDTALPSRDAILARCRDLSQRARAGVALVTLRSPAGVTGARVELDGQTLAAEMLDVPQPLDPGEHRVTVRVPGRRPNEQTLAAVSGQSATLQLEAGPEEVATPAPAPVAAPPAPRDPPAPQEVSRGGVPGAAVALLAVGGVSVIASSVFFGLRGSAATGCEVGPDPARPGEQVWICDTPSQVAAVGDRGTWTTLAGVTLGVGVAALGAGLAWWALGGRRTEGSPRPSAMVLPNGVVLGMEGGL